MKSSTKKIKLSVTSGKNSDVIIISNAINAIRLKLYTESWNSRPQYDEDAGVYVNSKPYNPLEYVGTFSIYSFFEDLDDVLKLTKDEQNKVDEVCGENRASFSMEVEREFTRLQSSIICQAMFFYMLDHDYGIESDYKRKIRDDYESDLHYSGKPLSEYLEQAVRDAASDKNLVKTLAHRFGNLFE